MRSEGKCGGRQGGPDGGGARGSVYVENLGLEVERLTGSGVTPRGRERFGGRRISGQLQCARRHQATAHQNLKPKRSLIGFPPSIVTNVITMRPTTASQNRQRREYFADLREAAAVS